MLYDYIIIGGGIIGTSIAREMSKYELKVLLIEKENEIGTIQTLHNSAIIHAGNDPKENTLKAKLNVLGNKMYDDLKKDLNIPLKRVGAFTVAHNEKELEELKILLQRATLNKVPGAYITTGTEARKLEPNLSKKITHVLFTPTTKITNPILTAQILMKNAYYNGVSLSLNTTVININYHNNSYIVKTSKGDFTANGIINAAGIYADNIAKLIDYDFPYHSIPKKGECLAFDDKTDGFISRVIYPLPSKSGKGILVIPKIDGTMLIGPTNKKQNSKEDYSIRNNFESRVHIGLDYFDATINRTSAWITGVRNVQKALLNSLLEPTKELINLELNQNYTKRLTMTEELKTYPIGDIYNYFCLINDVPVGMDWIFENEEYEKGLKISNQFINRYNRD